jgi:hypothetical protein
MKQRVRDLASEIINDSFPLLKGKKVIFTVMKFRFFAMSFLIPPSLRIIIISRRTEEFSDSVMTAIIAHELCHQERYLEMGTLKYLKFAANYLFSKRAQEEEEKATDRLTVEKGYARQLYQLTEISHNDGNHSAILTNYLTPDEIRGYAEELGKW